MKNDRFILDLFLGEMRSNVDILKSAFGDSADSQMLENVANSLKSSAKLVGFVELAALFAKLAEFFAAKNVFSKDDKNAQKCLEILDFLKQSSPDDIERNVDSRVQEINACAAAGFEAHESVRAAAQAEVVPDESGVERVDIDPSMKELFVLDVSGQVEVMSNTLVEMEGDFSSKPKLEALMRASHSVKGAARAVNLDSIVELTHQMENCFSAALNEKIALDENSLDVFFECVDFLSELCKSGFAAVNKARRAELLEGLKAVEGAKPAAFKSARAEVSVRSGAGDEHSSYVRISVENINSIMSLAAEGLIENRKFEQFRDAILAAKQEREHIQNKLEEAVNIVNSSVVDESVIRRLESVGAALRGESAALRNLAEAFSDYARKNVQLSARLYNEVFQSRMRPFSDLAQRFPKMVRDYSKSLSKKIAFEVSGTSASLDRDILEKLDAPIMHILRNACDHGIEPPEARAAAGKPEAGKITMRAAHSSGMFILSISDDGAGIDVEAVKRRILERRLVRSDILAQMHEEEIFEFLFLPAFTTKENVTEISGRGVGLDVVQTMLREIGGSVGVASKRGKGCEFTLKLPITRSVLKSLLVSIDSQPYAFPLSGVYRTVRIAQSQVRRDDGGAFFMLEKKRVVLADSAKVLGFDSASRENSDFLYVVVVAGRGKYWGFIVDGLPSEAELVVRSLNTSMGKIACVSAASLDADGLPVLILDMDDILIYASRLVSEVGQAAESSAHNSESVRQKNVLVVDDSATVREVEKKILQNAGYNITTAVDGVDGWNMVRLSSYDMVVTDIDMPRMSGFELTAKIRKLDKSLPVVIVSYKDRPEDKLRAAEAGANAYLTKSSFQDDSFVRTIDKFCK